MKDAGGKSDGPTKYMLDTNVFNHVLDGQLDLKQFAGHELFATHVQYDELCRTPSPDKRDELLSVFRLIEPKVIPTSTAVWGDSKWGQAKWSSADGLYQALLNRIKELDKQSGKKKLPENQSRDARIAETAIKEALILVTNDKSLISAAREKGCQVLGETEKRK